MLVQNVEVTISNKELGRGCYGVVYAGKYGTTDVAIKTFGLVPANSDDLAKAMQEASIWHSLKHPNIATHWGIAYDETKRPMLVVERLQMNLLERLKSNPTARERIKWLIDIAQAFRYLNSLNPPVIHRDLKPDNVLIDSSDKALLSDFGMSRVQALYTYHAVEPTKGCLLYAPPESYRRHYKATPKYDVYSFGMTMYEITTGRAPFAGEEVLDPQLVINWISVGERPDRRDSNGNEPAVHEIPDDLWNLIERCWDQDPNKRPDFTTICLELNSITFLENGDYDIPLQNQPKSSIVGDSAASAQTASLTSELEGFQFLDMNEDNLESNGLVASQPLPSSFAVRNIDLSLASPEEKSIISAAKNIAEGAYVLAVRYREGIDFEQNLEKSIMWFTFSANHGDPGAQFELAIYYYRGVNVPQDLRKAAKLFRLAASQGYVLAQVMLGRCYQLGEGVEKNMEKAASLYHLVNQSEDPKAAGLLDAVKQYMIKSYDFDETLTNSIFLEE
ncbi:kinase-like protein [Rhizoclosmatium globosum]|uniref:Kinase-like protein n=1 Tax=Rhizoclosmatium globosum TaxID=329046 RepID=A0A1Y2BSF3_9FUNG|nr:kinase-like protein [Rhizoclosmatium globosum]|eukprot:ORY37567.1 kinase-like protein [Rhizoclosmatium globosum]